MFVVDDVVVRPGEVNRDPRLQKIPLAKLFKSRVVTVVDQDGKPLRNAQVGARPAGESGSFTNFTTGSDGKSVVVTPDAAVDLVVALKGYRAETVANVTADTTVKLRKSTRKRVTLRLPENVEIPAPPFYLGTSLNWIGSSKPRALEDFDWSRPAQPGGRDRLLRRRPDRHDRGRHAGHLCGDGLVERAARGRRVGPEHRRRQACNRRGRRGRRRLRHRERRSRRR